MFVLQSESIPTLELPGLMVSHVQVENVVANFDLTLDAVERDGQLECLLESNADLFDDDRPDPGHVRGLDGGDHISAPQVVVAAGCWTGQIDIDGLPPLPIRPVRGQLLQLAWPGDPLKRIAWGPNCYIVPSAPHSVLVGATVEEAGFNERTTVAGIRDLLDAAADLVPEIWQAGFTAARVGLRPATPDHMPVIGRSSKVPGVVFATGHFRNGILLAPFTAKAVADLVLENREDPLLAAASPRRFEEY